MTFASSLIPSPSCLKSKNHLISITRNTPSLRSSESKLLTMMRSFFIINQKWAISYYHLRKCSKVSRKVSRKEGTTAILSHATLTLQTSQTGNNLNPQEIGKRWIGEGKNKEVSLHLRAVMIGEAICWFSKMKRGSAGMQAFPKNRSGQRSWYSFSKRPKK